MEAMYDLVALREGYEPSETAKRVLRESGLIVVGNELAGSGKDALIGALRGLPGTNYGFVPSRKTRVKRDGEEYGVDFVRSPIDKAVKEVERGNYVEWEPLRGTEINGTHVTELRKAIKQGIIPVKDAEVSGQAKLRSLNPDLKSIYPLPDLHYWIPMLERREGLDDVGITEFLAGADLRDHAETPKDFFDPKALKAEVDKRDDLRRRMEVAALQWELVWRIGAHRDPNTLFIVNKFGELSRTAVLAHLFIGHGERIPHVISGVCMKGEQVLDYLGRVGDIATEVLPKAA